MSQPEERRPIDAARPGRRLGTVRDFGVSRRRLGRLAALSFLTGVSQVFVLVLLGHLAVSATNGATAVRVRLGPVDQTWTAEGLLLWAFASSVVGLLLQWSVASETASLSADALRDRQTRIFSAYLGASWPLKAAQRDGGLQELMSNHATKSAAAVLWMAQGCAALFSLLALLVGAAALEPVATVAALGLSALLFAAVRPLMKRSRSHAAKYAAASVGLATSVTEGAALAQEATLLGVRPELERRVGRQVETSVTAYQRSKFFGALVPELYRSGAFLLLLAALAFAFRTDAGQIAQLGSMVLLLLRGLGYVQTLQRSAIYLVQLAPFQRELNASERELRASTPPGGGAVIAPHPTLSLRNATFTYDREVPALTDVSFDIPFGQTLGIVGPSGSGKSTLFQILLRLRSLESGDYRIDGRPVDETDLESWNRMIALVPQQPRLFKGTVAENIDFFRGLSRSDIVRAARLAHIHDDIELLPDGYDTDAGERGDEFSGGQRQRICLARALAGHPSILFLDEPTSALDMISEARIQQTLVDLKGKMTTIVVAHRPSTLKACDRILVLEEGQVSGIGPPDAVAEGNRYFSRMLALSSSDAVVSTPTTPGGST